MVAKPCRAKGGGKKFIRQLSLYSMTLPGLLIVLIFAYIPMYGIVIAFQDYSIVQSIFGSDWVGFRHFEEFLGNPMFGRIMSNTLILGALNTLWSFPAPIILALLLNEITQQKFKKVVQSISYLPYFISTVILVGMLKELASVDGGLFNKFVVMLGGEPINFFAESSWFRTLFIGSGIWQGVGWGSIIYLAALSNVDPQLIEAAIIDGANRWDRIRHISIPAIMPTIAILLIMGVGGVMNADSQKVLLMYSPQIYETADVIGTYTYREGILGARFSYTTAVGLFMSLISFVLLVTTNWASKKLSGGENSLW